LVKEIVAQWSGHWLAAAKISLVPLPANAELVRQKALHHCWLHAGEFSALGWSDEQMHILSGQMIGGMRGNAPVRVADRQILDRLGNRALEDLLERLLSAVGEDNKAMRSMEKSIAANESEWRWWRLGINRQTPCLMLGLSQSLMRKLARAALPPVSQPELAPVKVGLAKQQVAVGSHIGHCVLNLDEISNLAIGDLLILDQRADQLFDLTVAGLSAKQKCSLEQDDAGTVLIIGGNTIKGE
jgi:hypothetical protein